MCEVLQDNGDICFHGMLAHVGARLLLQAPFMAHRLVRGWVSCRRCPRCSCCRLGCCAWLTYRQHLPPALLLCVCSCRGHLPVYACERYVCCCSRCSRVVVFMFFATQPPGGRWLVGRCWRWTVPQGSLWRAACCAAAHTGCLWCGGAADLVAHLVSAREGAIRWSRPG